MSETQQERNPHEASASGGQTKPRFAINPFGLAFALVGAAVAVVGTFLPRADTTALGGIDKNTLLQNGAAFDIIIAAVALALLAYRSWSTGRKSWAIFIASAWLIGAAIYDGTGSRIALGHTDQNGSFTRVDSSAGVGIDAVALGGFLGLVGGFVMRKSPLAAPAPPMVAAATHEPTKRCPDCAETVLAAANVCRYCGHRFADASEIAPRDA